MGSLIPETAKKLFTAEGLKEAAQQSQRMLPIPRRLKKAIENFLQEQEKQDMKKKVSKLSDAMNEFKNVSTQLKSADGYESFQDIFDANERSNRWKLKSSYEDAGLRYKDDETLAYVATRMPAVYCAVHRVLREVKRRLPDFCPARVLDYGSGPGSVFWALRAIWSHSITDVNLVEPSKSMSYASRNLLRDVKGLPIIHSYENIQALNRNVTKSEREHDLVIASYVLAEIPSMKERITLARQLWGLTRDILVLIEPGTPGGSSTIRQIRSHILWMEKRKCRKSETTSKESSEAQESTMNSSSSSDTGAFVVAPCAHDGVCPMDKTGTFCHFVQRLERTYSQRTYKRSKGKPLRGYEDEKFSFVVLRRGQRPKSSWPLDGMKFDTLKEQHAKRNPEDLVIDYEDEFESETEQEYVPSEADNQEGSDLSDTTDEEDVYEAGEERPIADLGSGWGRIIFSPVRRGKRVTIDICRSTKRDGSEGSLDRLVIGKSKNPTLHHQARRSLWGDLWPF